MLTESGQTCEAAQDGAFARAGAWGNNIVRRIAGNAETRNLVSCPSRQTSSHLAWWKCFLHRAHGRHDDQTCRTCTIKTLEPRELSLGNQSPISHSHIERAVKRLIHPVPEFRSTTERTCPFVRYFMRPIGAASCHGTPLLGCDSRVLQMHIFQARISSAFQIRDETTSPPPGVSNCSPLGRQQLPAFNTNDMTSPSRCRTKLRTMTLGITSTNIYGVRHMTASNAQRSFIALRREYQYPAHQTQPSLATGVNVPRFTSVLC
jgi:hypothetical protein